MAFPEHTTISRIVVKSYLPRHWNDPACNLQEYDIQYCDETGTWQTLVDVRDNKQEVITHTFKPVTAKKIRLVARRGLFLSEIEVYER